MSRGLALFSAILALLLLPSLGTRRSPRPTPSIRRSRPGPGPTRRSRSARRQEIPPDWKGIRRDTSYFLGYQFIVIGVLYVMPTSVTTGTAATTTSSKWWDNVTHPGFDDDTLFINYVLASVLGRDLLHPRPGTRPEPLAIVRLLGLSLDPVRVRRRGPVREAVLSGSRRHPRGRLVARRVRLRADPRQHQGQGRARSTTGTSWRWSSPIPWEPPTT